MSLEYERADRGEMLRDLRRFFAPDNDSQQVCPLCSSVLSEVIEISDKEHIVARKTDCEHCPYIERDIMVKRDGCRWVVETPPWPEWDPESYDGSDEKLVWFLIALQSIHENPDASTEVSAEN